MFRLVPYKNLPLVQFENMRSDEVAGEYAEHDDYDDEMQVRL
jgi:hypothetical protein